MIVTPIENFAEAVKKMRTAQKEFFRTRSTIAKNEAIKLEHDVDKRIDIIIKPAGSSQPKLF